MPLPAALASALIAICALTGTASASVITSPAGTVYTGEIKGEVENGHAILHSENAPTAFTVECGGTVAGSVSQHGQSVTAGGAISSLAFSNCTNGATVVVNKAGSLEVHEKQGGGQFDGTATSSGAEITIHVPVLNIKCIYTTSNTDVGTLTGGTPATLDINSATIPRTGGSAFCGTGGFWTGNYVVTTPGTLLVEGLTWH
jgi:hypothetical protein